MVRSVHIKVDRQPGALIRKAAQLLARELVERSGVIATEDTSADAIVQLTTDPSIAAEGFRVTSEHGNAITVAGGDDRGVLYGVGKLLRGSRFEDGEVELSDWRGASIPARAIRGMYFATHFGNAYAAAPVEAIERYVEELALWGCNALAVWFDMHTYRGLDDPAAQAMIDRLRRILSAANAVGIRGGLTTIANEGYTDSPEALRADWTAGHDGYTSPPGDHYHREICPSKPGGLDYITTTRSEMLDAFADLDIAYVWIWPYDQGGCTCKQCAPWGANGFLRTAEPVAALVRQKLPNAQVILSTWYFDHFTAGEWEGLARAFAGGAPPWVDLLLAGDFGGFPDALTRLGVPGGLPVVSFPEISMEGNLPWGGYGANPRPSAWEAYEHANGHLLAGAFPYSEGIYEDINKVLTLQLGWSPEASAESIVREYAAYEVGPAVADDVVRLVSALESGLDHGLANDVRTQVLDTQIHAPEDLAGSKLYRFVDRPNALAAAAMVARMDRRLPARVRSCWRWRLLWLRATLDAELQRSGGRSTDLTERCFDELATLYSTGDALLAVTPPSRRALFRHFREHQDREPA
ncbi:MAG: hypothetical protein MUF84_10820 [Anaerolineae bacterium]|jgi:hypothetical protein|nr:hypothetical protein [Anaerolineae bacterium]